MAFESVRGYMQLASGLGDLTRAKALEAVQGLLASPGFEEAGRRAAQATALADELLETAKANRATLVRLVRAEIESALNRADIARNADLDALRADVARLTREVKSLPGGQASGGGRRATAGRTSTSASEAAVTTVPGEPARKRSAAKAGSTRKSTAKKGSAAAKMTTTKGAAKKSTGTKRAAKTTTTKGAPAKKSAATKSAATKSAASSSPSSGTVSAGGGGAQATREGAAWGRSSQEPATTPSTAPSADGAP